MSAVTERQMEVLRHSLGNEKMYRNYFATGEDGSDYETITELIQAGLMVRGRTMPPGMGDLTYFHVTDAGKALAWPAAIEGAEA